MNIDKEIPDEVCLDKCRCGAAGEFISTWHNNWRWWKAQCLICGYVTEVAAEQFLAMVEWNKRQRGIL